MHHSLLHTITSCASLLPRVCLALRSWQYLPPQAVSPRLLWVAADFFGPPDQLPDGDLVVLSRILHDWEEARGLKLLKTIYDKLPTGVTSLAEDCQAEVQ